MMNLIYDLEQIRKNASTIAEYLASIGEDHPAFSCRKREYHLDSDVVKGLKRLADKFSLVVFSAEWCSDCAKNVPVLGLIAEATGLEVLVFGKLKWNNINPEELWRIPPSPPEVRAFNVVKIPYIIVLDSRGEKVGEIVENPPEGQCLEQVLLSIVKSA